jgi:hypothetical protein
MRSGSGKGIDSLQKGQCLYSAEPEIKIYFLLLFKGHNFIKNSHCHSKIYLLFFS